MPAAPPPPYPTLVQVPDRIEGRRIVLRPLEVEDAPAVLEAVEESRPRLVDWVPWATSRNRTIEETIDYCAQKKAQWTLREVLHLGMFVRRPGHPEDGRYLGGIGFHAADRGATRIDWSFPALEIGYWIRSADEGQGYVGEGVEMTLGLAFESLAAPRVEARCDPTNVRSVRVIERAGFVREGVLRNENRWWDGGLGDTAVYSMLPADWQARVGRNRAPEGGPRAAPTDAGDRRGVLAIRPTTARKIIPAGPLPTTIAVPERIEGERVVARAWKADDAEALFEAANESRPRLKPWLPWADDHQTVEESRDFCLRCVARWILRTNLFFGIFSRESGRFLGGTGLHPCGTKEIDWSVPKFEIGYWIRTGEEGKGYVIEAVNLVTRLAFETLHARRVQIHCDLRNLRSLRVMEAAGYVREAVFRHDSLAFDGSGIRDTAAYALTGGDWARRPAARSSHEAV